MEEIWVAGQLISEEFAVEEKCELDSLVAGQEDRRRELNELEGILRASEFLENLKIATSYVKNYIQPENAKYYLIEYDYNDHSVSVSSYSDAVQSAAYLGSKEREIESGELNSNIVLVEVDKVTSLADAYPNYFGDVTIFIEKLNEICEKANTVPFVLPKQKVAPQKPYEKPDLTWFKNRHRRWTE